MTTHRRKIHSGVKELVDVEYMMQIIGLSFDHL